MSAISSGNAYSAYMFGWKHGVNGSEPHAAFIKHPSPHVAEMYRFGLEDGRKMRQTAQAQAVAYSGYTPSVTR